jgi:hypothetical protein
MIAGSHKTPPSIVGRAILIQLIAGKPIGAIYQNPDSRNKIIPLIRQAGLLPLRPHRN